MLPDEVRFRFVFAKCVSGYMCDIYHFVTKKMTTAKSLQTPSLTQKLQKLCRFGQYYLKELFKKSAIKEMCLIKAV